MKQSFVCKKHLWLVLVLLAICSLSAVSSYGNLGPIIEDAQSLTNDVYVIGPQNLLLIKILGETGVQQTFRVDDLGFITHPLIGRIKLGGLTVPQAEEELARILADGYIINPHVTLLVLEHSRFSVLGEVRKPGAYEILGQVSLMEAISIAGGLTPIANKDKIKLIRNEDGGEVTSMIDMDDAMEGKKESNSWVRGGDVIVVNKKFF